MMMGSKDSTEEQKEASITGISLAGASLQWNWVPLSFGVCENKKVAKVALVA